jgi:4-hydroxybenzoate polyprenyltransferase
MRLFRWPNLIIVALTQYLIHHWLIRAALESGGIAPLLEPEQVWLLIAVTLLITAAGYLHNDRIDEHIDRINRPRRALVNRHVSAATVEWVIAVMVIAGFILAFALAFDTGKTQYLGLYPLALAGLYLYNVRWKKIALLGNALIALYCAGAAGVMWLAEASALRQLMLSSPQTARASISILLWYMVFAFCATFFREIIKDIEDQRGDREAGYRTTPIRWGEPRAKMIAALAGAGLLLFAVVYALAYRSLLGVHGQVFIFAAVVFPLFLALIQLRVARSHTDYRRLSRLAKGIMLGGILLLLFVKI